MVQKYFFGSANFFPRAKNCLSAKKRVFFPFFRVGLIYNFEMLNKKLVNSLAILTQNNLSVLPGLGLLRFRPHKILLYYFEHKATSSGCFSFCVKRPPIGARKLTAWSVANKIILLLPSYSAGNKYFCHFKNNYTIYLW